MSYETKDVRDIEWNPEKMFAYTSPSMQPITVMYVEKKTIESMKKLIPPQLGSAGKGGGSYFREGGSYAGMASMSYFMKSPEVLEELLKDEEFVNRAIEHDVVWFIPALNDLFVF